MAWKLKKSKPGDDKAEDNGIPAAAFSSAAQEPGTDNFVDHATASEPYSESTDGPSSFDGGFDSIPSKFTPTSGFDTAADDPQSSSAPREEWNLDAFAPYKPSELFEAGSAGIDFESASHSVADFSTSSDDTHTDTVDLDEGGHTQEQSLDGDTGFDEIDGQHLKTPIDLSFDTISPAKGADWTNPEPGLGHDDISSPPVDNSTHPAGEPQSLNGYVGAPAEGSESTFMPGAPLADFNVADEAPIPAPAPIPTVAGPHVTVRLGAFSASYAVGSIDMVIGRPDPQNGVTPDISIEWDDAISRRHAMIMRQGESIYVQDLGSKNGTIVNGQSIPQNTPVLLHDGDIVRVGERTEIVFQA